MIKVNRTYYNNGKKKSKGDKEKQKSIWNHDDCAILHEQMSIIEKKGKLVKEEGERELIGFVMHI